MRPFSSPSRKWCCVKLGKIFESGAMSQFSVRRVGVAVCVTVLVILCLHGATGLPR
jgi:hypothetical protein